jgi:MtrB/PioB family decaheme-associated outer membrane protein
MENFMSIGKRVNIAGIGATLATAVLFSATPAFAQVDTSGWQCQFCPFPKEYQAEVEVGATAVSGDTFRIGNGSGYDESGTYADLGGEGHYTNDGYQLNWFAEDLGLASRVFEIDGGHQGKFGFYLGYKELPYRRFDSTSTVFTPASGGTLALPSAWVPASLTTGFTALNTSLQPRNIESDRQSVKAGGNFQAWSDFSVFVDYQHQQRDGVDIVSGANFVQSSLLPRMFDFETDLVDIGVAYSKGPLNLSLGWFGSFFKNNAASLTWDNPFTPFPGAEQGRLAQEPDNEFQQLSLSGSYLLDAMNSVIAFSVAMGQGEQTEELLPYTINPTIVAGNLPRSSLDGKVDTTNYAITVTSKPFPKARVNLAYRFDERDNQTAQSLWTGVVVDSFQSVESELNTPYSFQRGKLSVSGDYKLFDDVRVSAGYDRTDLERDFQEVADQTEDSGWGRVRWQPLNWLDVTAKGGASRREIDRYDTAIATSFGQNPLLRKYNLAHRYREFGELMIALTPAEHPYSIGLSALIADDSYSKSELGLTASKSTHISADLNYTLSERASVYLLGGYELIDASQSGSASFTTADWQADNEDRFNHYGAGIQFRELRENLDLTFDYLRSDGTTSITMLQSGSGSAFPDLESELESLRLNLNYRKSERLGIDFSLRYESFATRDWALDGVEPDTIATVLTLGAEPYDEEVWVFGASVRYLMGE